MSRRLALSVVVLAVLAVSIGAIGAGAAQTAANETSGDYSLSELRDGGVELEDGPSSQRFLSQYGSATIRYEPVGPLQGEWEYLDPGTKLHTDRLTLRTVRLAPESELDQTLNITVVAWQKGTREESASNGTVERQTAVNQSVLRQQVTLGRGYDDATIHLPRTYDKTRTVTLWIEEYPDARWKLRHRSVPSTQPVDIDTAGEAWAYTTTHAVLPGAIAILLGLGAAMWTRKRTGSGPRWGLIIWVIIAGAILFGVLSSAYFQVAVVLTYFPWLLGFVLFVLAYGGGLYMAGSVSTVVFERVELFDARVGPEDRRVVTGALDADDPDEDPEPIPDGGTVDTNGEAPDVEDVDERGDHRRGAPGGGLPEIKEVRYVEMTELPAIETPDGRIRVPKSGLRPFLARMWADAAELDKSALVTKIEVTGSRIDEKILVDPQQEKPVEHVPARLVRRWPVLHNVDEDAGLVDRITGLIGMLIVVAGLPAAGWLAGAQFGVPLVGAAIGALPALITGHTAKDGYVDFEPANEHFRRARATLVDLQREQADGKQLEDFREMAWQERARTAKEAMDIAEQHDKTLTTEMLARMSGFDLVDPRSGSASMDVDDTHPDAGGEKDDE